MEKLPGILRSVVWSTLVLIKVVVKSILLLARLFVSILGTQVITALWTILISLAKVSTPWTSSFLKAFLFLRIGPLSIPNSLPFPWFSFSVHFFTVLSTHRFSPVLPMSPDYRCLLVYSAFFGLLFSFPLFMFIVSFVFI